MDSTTQFISLMIVLFALVTTLLVTQAARRRVRIGLRPIPAYATLPLLVGEAIEADRPLHLSFGSTTIGGERTVLSLVTAEFFYQVARQTATGETTPIFTMSSTGVIPLAQDTLRRAYVSRGRLDRYRGSSIQWYPAGPGALAFAGALTAVQANEQVASNVIGGSFGIELALVLDAAARRRLTSIATSDRPEGQAVAFGMADYPLLGEEIFAAAAYLEGSPGQLGSLAAIDALRAFLILFIILPAVNALTDNAVYDGLARLFGTIFGGG